MAKKNAANNDSTLTNNAAPFVEEIGKGAAEEIKRILSRAQRTADTRLEAIRKQTKAETDDILNAATDRAEVERRRIISDLKLETKKIALKARGELVQEALDQVRARIERTRGTPEYRAMLKAFAIEGVLALDQSDVSVSVSPADAAMANDAFFEEVVAECGRSVKVTCTVDLGETAMGVVVRAADGSVLYDNTVGARMERMADELQLIVSHEVFSEQPGEA